MVRLSVLASAAALVLCLSDGLSDALAAAADPCTLMGLTGSCKTFPAAGPELIPFNEGYIPNFTAMATDAKAPPTPMQKMAAEQASAAAQDRLLDVRVQVSQMLDTVSDTELSPRAKLHIISSLQVLSLFSLNNKSRPTKVQIPWPLDDPKAAVQTVDAGHALEVLSSLLGTANTQALGALYDQKPKPTLIAKTEGQKSLLTVTPEREAEVLELIKKTRGYLVDQIVAGRAEGQLSPSETEALKKIRSINVTPMKDTARYSECQGLVPNAFYVPDNHSINICQNFYNMTDAVIVSVIGHEMGHSIDPCNSQFGTFRIDSSALAALKKSDGSLVDDVSKDEDRKSLFTLLTTLAKTEGVKGALLPLDFSPEAIKYFVDQGVINTESKGTPFSSYIFADTNRCLTTQEGFKDMSAADIHSFATSVTQWRSVEAGAGSGYDPAADQAKIEKAFATYPECAQAGQAMEAMADFFGSRALGEYLKDPNVPKPKTDLARLAPVSYFASLGCMNRSNVLKASSSASGSPNQVVTDAVKEFQEFTDSHPIPIERLERVFLAEPTVRDSICPGPGVPRVFSCTHDPKSVARPAVTTPAQRKVAPAKKAE